jgi:hypothetical protein
MLTNVIPLFNFIPIILEATANWLKVDNYFYYNFYVPLKPFRGWALGFRVYSFKFLMISDYILAMYQFNSFRFFQNGKAVMFFEVSRKKLHVIMSACRDR